MPRKDIAKEIQQFADSPIQDKISEKTKKKLLPQNLLSCGSTLVNLATSNLSCGALLKGRYYIMIGGSQTGKTWMYHAIFAESGLHKRFKDYRLIKDEPELGSDFDIAYYFGQKTASRIEQAWPGRTDKDGNDIPNSRTVEEFYDNVENKLDECEKDKVGMIYVLDSMDCLTTEASLKANAIAKENRAENKEISGSYGDGKAKVNSQRLRNVVSRLESTGSILIIICQERDNLASPVGGKTFSGGNALLFYACVQFWFKKIGAIDAVIKGRKRNLGSTTRCQIIKNRLTGQQDRDITVSYYHSFGIDDIGDIIDFLIEEKHWSGGKTATSKIDATEFEQCLNKESLVKYIQEDIEREKQVRQIAEKVWNDIQKDVYEKVKRVNRYE